MTAKPSTADASTPGLVPGVSYFQVLEPSKVLGPNGEKQFGMVGPFPTVLHANHYAASRPGALVTVTLVLLETPPIGAPALQAIAGHGDRS